MNFVRTALIGLMLVIGGQAHALLLTPSSFDSATDYMWTVSSPYKNPDAADVMAITGSIDLILLYKDNAGGAEEGPFQGSYDTSYDNEADPMNADLIYTGGNYIASSDPLWLLVKDGNNNPIWYLFDISGWDGTEDILLRDFWPDNGAISHVSIFGSRSSVTEPGSLLLLGLALVGLGLVRRRKNR